MKKSVLGLLAAAGLIFGGWFFLQHFQIVGLEGLQVVPKEDGTDGERPALFGDAQPPPRAADAIRVATFNIQVFGQSKAEKPQVMEMLAGICRRFDVVAVQEIRSQDQSLLPEFVERINRTGRKYDYAISPRLGRTVSKEQYAFIFDRETLEIDRSALYVVEDPHDLLHREPHVGWFRVRGVAESEAFTFTLVNIHTDPEETGQELDALGDVVRIVRGDGRNEDDVILLGDLNVDDRHLGRLGTIPGTTVVVSSTFTNVRQNAQYDNIVFQQQATGEFTGRGGVFDFLREYNLTLEEALEVSDHFPVWAEFSVYEGGVPGRVATRPGEGRRE